MTDLFDKFGVKPPAPAKGDLFDKFGVSEDNIPAAVNTERPQSFLPEGMQNFGAGAYEGMVKAVTGPIQFSLDAIAPEVGTKFTEFMNRQLQKTEKIYGGNTAFNVGEIGGNILPTLAVPAAGAAGAASALGRVASAGGLGFVLGSSGYHESLDPGQREAGRALGGGLGAVTAAPVQLTAEAISRSLNKLANSSALKKGMAAFQEKAASTDPVDTKLGEVVAKNVGKVNSKYTTMLEKENAYAGKIKGNVSGADISQELQPLQDKLNTGIDRNGKVRTILKNLIEQTKPKEMPLPADIERLGPNAKAQAMKILQLDKKDNLVPYSSLRTWSDQLDDILKSKGQQGYTDPQLGLLREAKGIVDGRIKEVQKGSPELQKLFRQTKKYKETTVDRWRDPEFKALFDGTPAERLQGAVEIANSSDAGIVQQLGKMLDKNSRAQVQSGLVKDALIKATKGPGNAPDPGAFIRYFNRSSLQPLMDPETTTLLGGMKNLMTQSALESDKVSKITGVAGRAARMTEHGLTIGGLWHLMRTGDVRGSALLFGGNVMAHVIHSSFDKMLQSASGRALLAASARAKPGSPRMARLADTIAENFPLPSITAQGSNALVNE